MSTFDAKCPNCSSVCDVPSAYINQEVKCPSCAETYVAEPCLDLPAPPIKAEEPKAPSTPQDGKMKKFRCGYTAENGFAVQESPREEIMATSAEEAAHLFSERHPSDYTGIEVFWGLTGVQSVDNHLTITQKREHEQERLLAWQRLESVYQCIQTVESADGNLRDLPYDDLSALVENMRDFPGIRDELSPEECAVREKLYMIAFFDRNLQAGLQAVTPRHPRFSPQSGKSPQSSSARSSEVSEVVCYLERIHYWIRFMGVVLLIQIILAVILMFFLWVS